MVNLSKNVWYCFSGCGCGGDVIEFVKRLDSKSYHQTAQYLAGLVSGNVVGQCDAPVAGPSSFRPFTTRLSLDCRCSFLSDKAIHPLTARRFDVGAYYGKGFLEGCIGVRLHDPDGRPVGYAGRRLDDMMVQKYGKWKFAPGLPKSKLLYNFHRVKTACNKGLVVVECPWGVLRLAQLSIPAVSLLGTSLSEPQSEMLKIFSSVILMMDGDSAGDKAIRRIQKRLSKYIRIRVFKLPTGCDPDDLQDNELLSVKTLFLS